MTEILGDRPDREPDPQRRLHDLKGEIERFDVHKELSLNDIDDNNHIKSSKKIVILDVNQSWCGPCKVLAPLLNELNGLFHDQMEIIKFTQDTNPEHDEITKKLPYTRGVDLPTLFIFNNGEKHSRSEFDLYKLFTDLEALGLKMEPAHWKRIFAMTLEAQPAQLLKMADKIPPDYRKEYLKEAAKAQPRVAFEEYEKNPQLFDKDFLETAARASLVVEYGQTGGNFVTFEFCHLFSQESFAEEILIEAAVKAPTDAYNDDNLKKYGDREYVLKILEASGNKEPGYYISYFPHSIAPNLPANKLPGATMLFERYAENFARDIAHPENFALVAGTIIDHKFSVGVENYGVRLLDRLIAANPVAGIMHPNRYEHLPDASWRLKSALERTIEVKPEAVFERFDSIFDIAKILTPEEKSYFVKKAATKAPARALQESYSILHLTDGESLMKEIVQDMANNNPDVLIKAAENGKMPEGKFYEEMLEAAKSKKQK